MSKFDLNEHIFRLLQREPFFASLSRRIDKKVSLGIKTAGVRINQDTGFFEMLYNPEFFEGLPDEQREGVITHEFYHLIFEHVTGRLPDELEGAMRKPTPEQASLFRLWNIATDLSINCMIGKNKLPETCCFPGVGPFEGFSEKLTAEVYYKMLKEKKEEAEGNGDPDPFGGESGQFDDHSEWAQGESGSTMDEIAKERLKEALREAVNDAASSSSWGSISGDVRKDILERISSKVDWRKVLRYFVKSSQRSSKRSTPKRLNRRYAYIHPGRKVTRQARIAISVDQSGSVSDMMLEAFYAELNSLSEIATFTVVPFDTKVAEDKVYVWKKGERRKRERVLYGGTDFNAPTAYVNDNGFDGHILLTDMCAPKPKRSSCPRMWMTDKRNAAHPYFKTNERVVAIDV